MTKSSYKKLRKVIFWQYP